MNKFYALTALIVLSLSSFTARADAPEYGFICEPNDFSLIYQPTFSDSMAKYVLAGEIIFPAAGYGYRLERGEDDFDNKNYIMHIVPPPDESATVEINLPVEFDFLAEDDMQILKIKMDKDRPEFIPFNQIICERAKDVQEKQNIQQNSPGE